MVEPAPSLNDGSKEKPRRFAGNSGFFAVVFAVTGLLCLVALGPLVLNELCRRLGWDEFALLDRRWVNLGVLASLIITSLAYLRCLSNANHLGFRTLIVLCAVLMQVSVFAGYRGAQRSDLAGKEVNLIATKNIYERQWSALRRLKLVEYVSPTLADFDARAAANALLQDFKALHRWIMEKFAQQKAKIRAELNIDDEDRLKVIFCMHFVTNLWSFGNRHHPDKVGCACKNEENNWTMPDRVTVQTYLQAKIGCCSDMAHMMKYLMDQEKMESRLTRIPGHIFNEVKLDGKWHIVDATINAIAQTSWEENYQAEQGSVPDSIKVMLFPHPNLDEDEPGDYRSLPGHFRLMMLIRLANRPESHKQAVYPELPDHFN